MARIDGAREWRNWVKRLIEDMEMAGPPNLAIYRWTFVVQTNEGIPECNHRECNEPPLFAVVGWVGDSMTEGDYEILLVCEVHVKQLVSSLLASDMEPLE